jgi:hypothetical protein
VATSWPRSAAAETPSRSGPAPPKTVIEFALTDQYDVAVVVSLDRDLCEIPAALGRLHKLLPHPVRLEAAVPVPDGLSQPKTLAGFQYTHQITPSVFELIRDDTRYDAAPENWKVPQPLAFLDQRRAELAR